MAHTNLRAAVLRLASRRADLRPHLLPLLLPSEGNNPAPAPVAPVASPAPAPVAPVMSPAPVAAPAMPFIMQSAPAPAPVIFQAPPAPAPVILMPGAVPPAPAPAPAPAPGPAAPTGPTFSAPPPTTLTDFGSGVFVTSRTQHGFDVDLAPEMTRMLQLGMTKDQVADWAKMRVRDAFRIKDSLYMILIRYQSTFENDEQFRLSLERAIDIWRVTEGNTAPSEV